MFESKNYIAYFAITQWAKYIETGSFVGMDKSTILELARSDKDIQKVASKLPTLTREQQEFVYRLQDLANEIITKKPLEE